MNRGTLYSHLGEKRHSQQHASPPHFTVLLLIALSAVAPHSPVQFYLPRKEGAPISEGNLAVGGGTARQPLRQFLRVRSADYPPALRSANPKSYTAPEA